MSPSLVPQFSSFSAFLEDTDDDDDLDVEAADPLSVSIVGDKVQRARVAHCLRLGSLEWEDLKHKVPENLLEGSPGRENSAAAQCGMCWRRLALAVRDGIGVVPLRHEAGLFNHLEWL